MGKNAVFCIVKNEARDIGEWLAHHFAIGFDSVIVYDNGSSDNTRNVILRFTEKYDARLVLWTRTDRAYQRDAFLHAAHRFGHEFDWALCIELRRIPHRMP